MSDEVCVGGGGGGGGGGGWRWGGGGCSSCSPCANILCTKYSAIANFSVLQCGNAGRDIKIKNYDHYLEVVHSLRKDRTKTALVEYFFW